MRLRTLGSLRLEPPDFHRPKPLLLLAYLAVEGTKDRRHLSELFWPDASQPTTSLRVALGQLRKGAPGALCEDGERVGLGLESDVAALLDAVREGRHAAVPALYAGAFLDGFALADWPAELEEWVYATREFVGSQVRGALLRAAEAEAARGRFLEAAREATRAYQLRGASPLEADELERLHALLAAGDSPLVGDLQREAREFGLELRLDPDQARQRYAPGLAATGAARPTPNNLPASKTSFIGRDPELVEIGNALSGGELRLVTLLGPGGIGKTRLALQSAHDQLQEPRFRDGVYFVALENLTAGDQIPRAIAGALGLSLQGNADALERLIEAIGLKSVLIVLDNVEHLVHEAGVTASLLEACPKLSLLVTSRERLKFEQEFVLTVSGVSLPARGSSLAEAELSDAVRLFVQRARRARIEYALCEDDLAAVLEICRLVEGSPLGIELAAAWVRALPAAEIAAEIARNLDILETSVRNAKDAHRSLRAVFEQSWERLSSREQEVFSCLAVFEGGFTREAASQVVDATIPVLASLVDKSLLRVSAEGRFDRHALVYQYALEKLTARPERHALTRNRHARYFLDLAETAAPELYGVSKTPWLARLSQEHENLRAALEWARVESDYELGLRLAGALKNFWLIRGYLREGAEVLERLLSLEAASEARVPASVRATALTGAAWLAHAQDDFVRATTFFEESAALQRTLGATGGFEAALVNEAMLARAEGDYARATALLEESLARHRSEGNRESIGRDGIGLSLSRLALVFCEQGQFERAEALYDECLALHLALGDRGGIAATLLGQSDIAREQADAVRTRALAEGSLKLFESLGEVWGVAFSLNNLALAAYLQGDLERAASLAQESTARARTLWGGAPSAESLSSVALIALARNDLELARASLAESLSAARRYGPRWLVAVGLEGFAWLALRSLRPIRAAQLVGASLALHEAIGVSLSPLRRPIFDRVVRETREALGSEAWTSACELGASLPLEQAVSLALAQDAEPEIRSSSRAEI